MWIFAIFLLGISSPFDDILGEPDFQLIDDEELTEDDRQIDREVEERDLKYG